MIVVVVVSVIRGHRSHDDDVMIVYIVHILRCRFYNRAVVEGFTAGKTLYCRQNALLRQSDLLLQTVLQWNIALLR